ncbi:protein of unknown function [Taphrina deformans PYCC 5710]|uniref:Uncharacterized protein n=1 Tax=Taphrina deformans (strain PYCC 5710 / ATCC 11124 / CBS 356.35 / IMI 108563 / JCM 9778 / NBRC 8474) TaxID=1097556 RepID=R4XFQ6_TAPDE|nr:protein of unknown function [Taphrina deformans PYCC 5710]|eukprot:CCG84691.1 protein of unknown function [Taphrina deformans PYCC 5710]
MSFTSVQSVVIDVPCEVCFNLLSDTALFVEFMGLSAITSDVRITSTDTVLLSASLQVVELESRTVNHESYETCSRIKFELTENVVYLGIAKEVLVAGDLVMSSAQKLHVEHREANAGLVVTDKIRRFHAVTGAHSRESDPAKVSEVSKVRAKQPSDEQQLDTAKPDVDAEKTPRMMTEIVEEITGSTSWYLQFFVAMEARSSHEQIVQLYPDYLARHLTVT